MREFDRIMQRIHASVVSEDMTLKDAVQEVKRLLKKFSQTERATLTYMLCIQQPIPVAHMRIASASPLTIDGMLYNREWKFTVTDDTMWKFVLRTDPFLILEDHIVYSGETEQPITPQQAEFLISECQGRALNDMQGKGIMHKPIYPRGKESSQ